MKWESAPESGLLQQVRDDSTGLAVIGAVALGLAVLFLVRRCRGKRGGTSCQWRRDKARVRAGFDAWRCKTCGSEGFSSDGTKPKACLRGMGGRL